MSEVRMGIWRHWKNHLYQVIGCAHDANTDWRTCVVYIPLELDGAHLGLRMAVRTYEDFLAWVNKDGSMHVPEPRSAEDKDKLLAEGWVPRFEYLGMELTGDMLVKRD